MILDTRNHAQRLKTATGAVPEIAARALRLWEWTAAITTPPWGMLPVILLSSSIGLLLVALGYVAARQGRGWMDFAFWSGLLIFFVPIAARLVSTTAYRRERISLVMILGIGLYIAKMLHSPTHFTFSDEFTHWRTAEDILASGRMFERNPLLPISPLYPGLELVTSALVSISGMSIFTASLFVLSSARMVLVLALYLFCERISQSARIAGVASLIYAANPNFLFFTSQFSYESLSLPLAILALCLVARRQRASKRNYRGLTIAALLAVGSVIITHHLTSYALVAFLLAWAVTGVIISKLKRQPQRAPVDIALIALAATVTWFLLIGNATTGYLAPHFGKTLVELGKLITGELTGRELFRASSGFVPPLWERLAGFASPGLMAATLPLGLLYIWRRFRSRAAVVVLGLAALTYPVSLLARLTQAGAEISNRTSEFLFLALGFVAAVGVIQVWPPLMRRLLRKPRMRHPAIYFIFTITASVIFVGSTVVGWAPWARLPGDYLVSADTRSIEVQGISAAQWANQWLGPGQHIIADRINRQLMGSYGQQRPVTSYADKVQVAKVFVAREITQRELRILEQGQIEYIVVDYRLATALPFAGIYFERGEPEEGRRSEPLNLAALLKFDQLRWAQRVFDNGNIVIYDIQSLGFNP